MSIGGRRCLWSKLKTNREDDRPAAADFLAAGFLAADFLAAFFVGTTTQSMERSAHR